MNRSLLVAGAAALVLLTAACGDDGAATTSPTTATTAAASTTTATTTTAATTTSAGEDGGTVVEVSGFVFHPGDLVVTAGTTVTWVNQDRATHTTSSTDGLWNQGLASGASFQFTFTTPGTYPYMCNIHPSMTGTITVTS